MCVVSRSQVQTLFLAVPIGAAPGAFWMNWCLAAAPLLCLLAVAPLEVRFLRSEHDAGADAGTCGAAEGAEAMGVGVDRCRSIRLSNSCDRSGSSAVVTVAASTAAPSVDKGLRNASYV